MTRRQSCETHSGPFAATAVAALVAIGNACARSDRTSTIDAPGVPLFNRGDFPHSEIDFRFGDHQQFLRDRHEPLRGR